MKGKGNVARGHNLAPILGKGCSHQLKNEYIPEIDDELNEFYSFWEDFDEEFSKSSCNFGLSV
jgi:hypothetical protein